MATFNKFDQFVEDLANGVHNFGTDAITVALSNTLPTAGNTILANITQIAYTNLPTSRVLAGTSAQQTSGTCTFAANDLTLTATGAVAQFQYVVLYNDTPTSPVDPLIGWYDYGSGVTLANGETFTVDFTTGFATLA